MFKRKRGIYAAPKKPEAFAASLQTFFDGLRLEDKARVAAASQTEHGELELRLRIRKDGSQAYSIWLCVENSDDAIKIIPEPTGGTAHG